MHGLYFDMASSRVETSTGFERVVLDQFITSLSVSHHLKGVRCPNSKMQPQTRMITDLLHVVNARLCNNRLSRVF